MSNTLLTALNSGIIRQLSSKNYAGHDPFDFLNSQILKRTPFYRNEYVRLAWLQLGKRLPINLRSILRVPKKRNPKGIGLIILGLVHDFKRTSQESFLREAIDLGDWLLTQRSDPELWVHSCWGYHFDWQARAFYVPAHKPNMITTVYVSRALLALSEISGLDRFRDAALDSARFIRESLYTEDAEGGFYAYIPGEEAFVHNASLWGAAWCIQVAHCTSDTEMANEALGVVRRSVNAQRLDGSWVYGARKHHQFVDGFHSGYNLEALDMIRGVLASKEFDAAIKLGYDFYKRTFFEEDGTTKYYSNNTYPIDFHSVSQAILTLEKLGKGKDRELCEKVINRSIELMYLPSEERFIYQRHRYYSNKIDYMRWTQAWAYYVFSFYNFSITEDF